MARYVGVDLGATNVRAVVGDEDGTVQSRTRRPTPQGPSGIAVTEAVLETVRAACDDIGIAPPAVAAAGIGSIGPLDLAEGAVTDPANLPIEGRIPLVGPMSELLDTDRITLHNDTAAGVIGERFYSDRTPDDMVYVTMSTGIGAGVCVDGNVLSGWDGNAGEVGHVTLDPAGTMTCGCGRPGHWEAYCSGENIPRYARYLHRETDIGTRLPLEDLDAAKVFAAADTDDPDPLAVETIDRIAEWNALGIGTVVHAYAPLVVVLGGTVALKNPQLIVDPIKERLSEVVMTNVPDLRLTNLGDDVVVKGALAAALTGGTGDRTRQTTQG